MARSLNSLGIRDKVTPHTLCGCYYCFRVFPARRIKEWRHSGIAVCPYCGIDSVVINDISYAYLKRLNEELFDAPPLKVWKSPGNV